ncbi:CIA30 family protein [Colwellia sp. 12G3]|uniref:CIA30 family protein n=1 Tax=Colwellia sp. 12G3 TaxID=2058299 RepID=UPI0012FEC67D|nr:CIA30 family protein [Colwellia sp. 12G3]
MKNTKLAITFEQGDTSDEWQALNDGVMGGLSVGNAKHKDQALVFSGRLSTENYGGFSSVYKKLSLLPETVNSISIRIKGDGNPYQLRMRSKVMDYNVAYKVEFKTEVDKVEVHHFNLTDFKASFRGRIIDNAPVLTVSGISHVGFLIATKQPRDFSLLIYALEFYRS